MNVALGIFILVVSGFAFVGQVVSALWPEAAQKAGLQERESEVERSFFVDARAEAIWDAFILWTLPVAGVLLAVGHPSWTSLALIGGGAYLYFAGRGILARALMRRRGLRVGEAKAFAIAVASLVVWGATAALALVLAIAWG